MNLWSYHFAVSGVDTFPLLPPAVAFLISFFTSMAGISGAFLLLPFQVSVLGFTSPAVTATNFLYNVVGTPGGFLRYLGEKRIVWPLAAGIISGTLPGLLAGYYLRVKYLTDPRAFKLFVGMVLLYVGARLLHGLLAAAGGNPADAAVTATGDATFGFGRVSFTFRGEVFGFRFSVILLLSLAVGIVGGMYGIGGGAIIAPFCVSVLRLPVYAVAGAVLMGNFLTSLAGVCFYSLIPLHQGQTAPPDWLLGIAFGLGGLAGMYSGARWQRRVPEKWIKLLLAGIVFSVAARYIIQFFQPSAG